MSDEPELRLIRGGDDELADTPLIENLLAFRSARDDAPYLDELYARLRAMYANRRNGVRIAMRVTWVAHFLILGHDTGERRTYAEMADLIGCSVREVERAVAIFKRLYGDTAFVRRD